MALRIVGRRSYGSSELWAVGIEIRTHGYMEAGNSVETETILIIH